MLRYYQSFLNKWKCKDLVNDTFIKWIAREMSIFFVKSIKSTFIWHIFESGCFCRHPSSSTDRGWLSNVLRNGRDPYIHQVIWDPDNRKNWYVVLLRKASKIRHDAKKKKIWIYAKMSSKPWKNILGDKIILGFRNFD